MCWPISTIRILREGSAAASLPAMTHAVVPPGVIGEQSQHGGA